MMMMMKQWQSLGIAVLFCLCCRHRLVSARPLHPSHAAKIVVIGSINADTFFTLQRLPVEGENLTTDTEPECYVPGGKGCTQAVAAAKLILSSLETEPIHPTRVEFVGQFGNDAGPLIEVLKQAGVDISHCGYHADWACGKGYVFLTASGQVSAIVTGGSNRYGWKEWEIEYERFCRQNRQSSKIDILDQILQDCRIVMLQREIPEFVNELVASYCQVRYPDIQILQDVGGEDRPISKEHLQRCHYIIPNETELKRLLISLGEKEDITRTENVVNLAKRFQKHGARNVLVTQGRKGSTLVAETGQIYYQPACTVPHVVDETGAGDCYRAGLAVSLLLSSSSNNEGCSSSFSSISDAMRLASAAGACSVQKKGAVPSTPTRKDVESMLKMMQHSKQREPHHHQHQHPEDDVLKIPRGDGIRGGSSSIDDFPFLIGSRLNSMKDRPELWHAPLLTPKDYVQRQASISGLTCVDFNYPQHFHSWTSQEAKTSLEESGLLAGAVCLRFPSKFARGAMNHPDKTLRREAIRLTKEAAQAAIELGCKEVVVWSAYDGYDYPFQVHYDTKWKELVDAFRECCDAFPEIKFSIEYKPTDENTRFFTVPSTGAALLLVHEVDRPNFGLTLDVGHMLMSGENPGQSIAMVGRSGKLFGIQLNDGFTRLAAEDGLMFGSVHPSMALEIMYQLRCTGFAGHFYFDTFPQRTDPVAEAEYNIKRVKAFWKAAGSIDQRRLREVMEEHDAIGALELVNDALREV
jgi:sugar/nucleoside kinase (ribokinase family)/sugar phosphate isomerase/epimerase